MLKSTPQSLTESQPLVSESRGLAIVADGRLDNRSVLYSRLRPGFDPDLATDAEFILAAYDQWGDSCPQYLLGDFSFAIWDRRRQALFCARDQVGAASFHYLKKENYFAFASDLEALLTLPSVSKEPNENFIASFLAPAFENYGDDQSWQADVRVLMPGHSLEISANGGIRRKRYWELSMREKRTYVSTTECDEHFLEVFSKATANRLRCAGKPAVMMSGGLDTAGIMAGLHRQISKHHGGGVSTYSAISDDANHCVESQAIRGLQCAFNTQSDVVSVPSFKGMVNVHDLQDMAIRHAHPVNNSILLPALMCLAASRDGHRVMFHGASGDICMGVPHYYQTGLIRQGRLLNAWRESRMASRHNLFLLGRPSTSIFLRSALFAWMPRGVVQKLRDNRFNAKSIITENQLLSREFSKRIDLEEKVEREYMRGQHASRGPWYRPLWKSAMYLQSGLSGYGRVASCAGIELRDPWADLDVLDFFLRLPVELAVRDGWSKSVVRSAFKDELPAEVVGRHDKKHLGWEFNSRFMSESHTLIQEMIEDGLEIVRPYLDTQVLLNSYEEFKRERDDWNTDRLFAALTLYLWLRRINSL